MNIPERTRESLRRKQDALKSVVTPWRNQERGNQGPGNPHFPRMTSQIDAANNLLKGLVERIDDDLKAKVIQPGPIENRILGAYQFWNVFDRKFTQRLQINLEPFLKATDELAWLCYKPAREAAFGATSSKCKEPPLVYFSNEASPFVDPRNARFHPEGVPSIMIQAYGWPAAVTRLPFSLIGVPWFQSGFLPGALAIAHEVGHAVESDFDLGPRLRDLIETALPSSSTRQPHWKRWTGEMFADLWGCLAVGPAFPRALAELLVSRDDSSSSVNFTGEYPPPPLRVWWNHQILETMGSRVPLGELWPKPHPIFEQEFLNDASRIAVSWLEAKLAGLGGNELRTVLNFTSQQQETAEKQAESARNGKADQSSDVRALWASVQLVWDKELTEVILDRIVAACDNAVRRRTADVPVSDDRGKYVHGLGYQIL